MSHMKSLNNNIRIIAPVWFLMQGVLLFLNEIRVYYYVDNKNGIDCFFIYVSVFLIVTSLLLLIKNRKIILFLSGVLFLYSIFVMYAMAVLFFMEANNVFLSIVLCFVIPVLNTVFSFVLIRNTLIKRRSRDLTKH